MMKLCLNLGKVTGYPMRKKTLGIKVGLSAMK